MRCLILGGAGMLGHRLLKSWQDRYDVRVALRKGLSDYAASGLFHSENSYCNVDVRDTDRLLEILADFRPDAVVNAVGIIKQRSAAKDAIPSLEINSVFPHRLQRLCQLVGARMVHVSTDCVFDGRDGSYTEESFSNAEDLYGRSKYLGEVSESPCITLRSSIIGLELSQKASLIEWFLAQSGTIKGFTNAIYTGVTTAEMARVIEHVCTVKKDLCGVWQVASNRISKFDLLSRLSRKLGRTDLTIEPDDSFFCDRSLVGTAFERVAEYTIPSWDEMLDELADEILSRESASTSIAA
ncbi:MAG: SDR family oxidoreductase [Planctomycetaceae bacterium]